MCGTALAASSVLTVIRTISEPASASSITWRTVASTSAVSVLVMDCTMIGAPPPSVTEPTGTARLQWREISLSATMAVPRCVACASYGISHGRPARRNLQDLRYDNALSGRLLRGCDQAVGIERDVAPYGAP